jgi:hypothetical protein
MFLLQEYAGAFSSVQTGVFRVSDGGAAASAHNDTMPLDAAGLSRLLSRWLSSWRAHTPRRTAGARPVKLGQSLCALLQDGPARLPVMNAFQVRHMLASWARRYMHETRSERCGRC